MGLFSFGKQCLKCDGKGWYQGTTWRGGGGENGVEQRVHAKIGCEHCGGKGEDSGSGSYLTKYFKSGSGRVSKEKYLEQKKIIDSRGSSYL